MKTNVRVTDVICTKNKRTNQISFIQMRCRATTIKVQTCKCLFSKMISGKSVIIIITPLITFKEIDFYQFLMLCSFFISTISGKMAKFCIYFTLIPYANHLQFFPSLYDHLKPFLKCRPLQFISNFPFITFRNFSNPLLIRAPILF